MGSKGITEFEQSILYCVVTRLEIGKVKDVIKQIDPTDRLITASVPFNFVINDRSLPAGEYVFALIQVGGSDAVKIQSADGHITAFVPTRPARAKASQTEPKLVFNRYGDHYLLSQVCGLEDSTTQHLPKPRAEHRMAKTEAEKKNVSIAAHKTMAVDE